MKMRWPVRSTTGAGREGGRHVARSSSRSAAADGRRTSAKREEPRDAAGPSGHRDRQPASAEPMPGRPRDSVAGRFIVILHRERCATLEAMSSQSPQCPRHAHKIGADPREQGGRVSRKALPTRLDRASLRARSALATLGQQRARGLRRRVAVGAERRLDLERARSTGFGLGALARQQAARVRAGSGSIRAPRAPRRTGARESVPRARRRRSPRRRRPAPSRTSARQIRPHAVHSCSGPKLPSQISRVRRASVSASAQRPSKRSASARCHIVRPMSGLSTASRCCCTARARRSSGSAAAGLPFLVSTSLSDVSAIGGLRRLRSGDALANLQHATAELLRLVEPVELLGQVGDVAQRAEGQWMFGVRARARGPRGPAEERLGRRVLAAGLKTAAEHGQRARRVGVIVAERLAAEWSTHAAAPARRRPSRAAAPPPAPDW